MKKVDREEQLRGFATANSEAVLDAIPKQRCEQMGDASGNRDGRRRWLFKAVLRASCERSSIRRGE
jgi:hypothetical protein